MVENEQRDRPLAVGERPDRQPQHAPVVEQSGVESVAALRVEDCGGLDLLPEFIRLELALHHFERARSATSFVVGVQVLVEKYFAPMV